jgi:hypothetical protein
VMCAELHADRKRGPLATYWCYFVDSKHGIRIQITSSPLSYSIQAYCLHYITEWLSPQHSRHYS